MGLVRYRLEGRVATIAMDDGKVNALSLALQGELHAALDRAVEDRAIVVITGRAGVFSAGFDLTTLRAGGDDAVAMLRGGFELSHRLLSFPYPVIVACTGHAIAMGLFLALSGDYRVGAAGPYKLTANEVAIGLTVPTAAIEVLRLRVAPAALDRAAILAEPFTPATAVAAGLLDRVVDEPELAATARALAESVSTLDLAAHAATKLRVRGPALERIRAAIEAELPRAA